MVWYWFVSLSRNVAAHNASYGTHVMNRGDDTHYSYSIHMYKKYMLYLVLCYRQKHIIAEN